MSADHLTILAAKVAVLEQLVRALLREEFRKADDPAQAAQYYAERMKRRMEDGMRGGPHHPAAVLMTENIDLFFDVLMRELSGTPEQSGGDSAP